MSTQQQQFIREKCIAANPSIKDLVFGCEIVIKETIRDGGIPMKYDKSICLINLEPLTEEELRKQIKKPIVEIIGREIRLADVLLVFTHISLPTLELNVIGAPSLPALSMTVKKVGGAIWNLKDSLTDQTPETISFIYQLLSGK